MKQYNEWQIQMDHEENLDNFYNRRYRENLPNKTVTHYENELNTILDNRRRMTRHLLIIFSSALPYVLLIISCFFVRNFEYSVLSIFLGLSIPFGIYFIVCKYFEYHDKIKKVKAELRESEIDAAKRYPQQQESQGDKPW